MGRIFIRAVPLSGMITVCGFITEAYGVRSSFAQPSDGPELVLALKFLLMLALAIGVESIARRVTNNRKVVISVLVIGLLAITFGLRQVGPLIVVCLMVLALIAIVAVISRLKSPLQNSQGQGYGQPFNNVITPFGVQTPLRSARSAGQNLYDHFTAVLYHGTPKLENARNIINGGGTFVIGPGNTNGTGLYLADFHIAQGYAGNKGAVLKVKVQAPWEQIADHNDVTKSQSYRTWVNSNGNGDSGENLKNYTLYVLRKRFLRVNDSIYVALGHRTKNDERVIFEGLTVLEVLGPNGDSLDLY
ncbi:conserved domain protein [delta proteobacterium NaphS2]|nr:conserved domain protein [delta proteobacterium NaphS2]